MRHDMSRGNKKAIVIVTTCLILAMPLLAQAKKLQVITDRANLYLDADERSPVV